MWAFSMKYQFDFCLSNSALYRRTRWSYTDCSSPSGIRCRPKCEGQEWRSFISHWTALHRAALWSHLSVIKALHEKNANLNVIDEGSWTPLHVAVKWNRIKAVDLLLNLGANVNLKNDSGNLPINLAEQYQLSKIANLLRKAQGEQAIKAALASME